MAGAMFDEEDRSGEAIASRIPDEFMKVARKAAYEIASKGSLLVSHTEPTLSLAILSPTEGLWLFFKVVVLAALILSSPFWLYFAFDFISPALHQQVRSKATTLILAAFFALAASSHLAWHTIIPFTIRYLFEINSAFGQNFWSLSSYLSFILQLLFAAAIASELILLLFFAIHFGWLHPELLANKRRHAIFAIFLIAAVITPPDVLSQFALALPLLLCYELAIWYGYFLLKNSTQRRKDAKTR
jgi:sec-independent protein translocase protein TatC